MAALERHRLTVRAFYDSVFGRAAQAAIGEEPSDPLLDRIDDESLKARLRDAGFPRPEAVLRPLKLVRRALQDSAGSPELRRALRRAGPVVLHAAADALHPKRALENLEKLLVSVTATPGRLLRLLSRRENLAPTIRLLGRSDLFAGLLIRQPGILREIEDRSRILRAAGPEDYRRALQECVAPREAPLTARAGQLRRRQQEALATIALREINGQATLRETLKGLSDLADATVEAAMTLGRDAAEERAVPSPAGLRMAVLGLGRLGYRELDYLSDLDLVFVYASEGPDEGGARAAAGRWAAATVRTLSSLSRDGQLYQVDLRLRPSGREGDIVASVAGLTAYFRGEAEVWELQSFLKARPVAGDRDLGARVVSELEAILLERAARLGPATVGRAVEDMGRRLRAGAAGTRAGFKLGEGGILDVHFAIEFLQLAHSVAAPPDKDTLRMLTHLRNLGLLEEEPLQALYQGYLFLRSLDHTMRLMRERPLDLLPEDPRGLGELARAMEMPGDDPADTGRRLQVLVRERRRAIRRAYEAVLAGAARDR
jgi:[glutamine synthetase] adenylyltransferase / [glutamine synthetase]-adenylyl-L-tyrosine phosphorylase